MHVLCVYLHGVASSKMLSEYCASTLVKNAFKQNAIDYIVLPGIVLIFFQTRFCADKIWALR